MHVFVSQLGNAAHYGRALLVAGLIAGIALPGIAVAMKPWLPELVAALLFIAALRIGPKQAIGSLRDLPLTLGFVLANQLAFPFLAIILLAAIGQMEELPALCLILMLAASPISGSPNLTIMAGGEPAPSLRALILGTALLPLTVMPVFWLAPVLGSSADVIGASGRLLALIAISGALAFLIRGLVLAELAKQSIRALDGLSAIAMAVIVIGLMAAVGPAIFSRPLLFLAWLAFAFTANFGMQLLVFFLARRTQTARIAFAIAGGNRNIALFLVALPASVTDPLLLFIGCYQIPMYLTPLMMGWLYNASTEEPDG